MNASPVRRCVICGKPRHPDFTTFCSARCRDRDLVRWLDDGYALKGSPSDPDVPGMDGDGTSTLD